MFKLEMKSKFNYFLQIFGVKGIFAVLLYPLIILMATPIRLIQTLWNCRVLAEGKAWNIYPHFSSSMSLNSLFYWSRALNLHRYGRTGISPYMGNGDYRQTRCFHYSLISLFCYWKAGAVTLLVGMFGWLIGHFLWFDIPEINKAWLGAIIFFALISTMFYSQTFFRQNYNVLGWSFLPICIFGWFTNNWMIATLAWFGASFCSFTVVFIGVLLSVVYSAQIYSLIPILTVFPAVVKLLTHFWPNLLHDDLLKIIKSVAKAIGLTKINVRYKRSKTMNLSLRKIYFSILYLQFLFVYTYLNKEIPYLFLAGLCMWFINCLIARFADDQSMYMMMFSLSAAYCCNTNIHNILLLSSYWLVISPIPLLYGFDDQNCVSVVPIMKPFNIKEILKDMESFFSPVKRGEKILMAFNAPKENRYELLYDGYRSIVQVPLYIASLKEIHCMPDWWGIFELNYEGAPDFWGRDVEKVNDQMQFWKADYVIIYQKAGTLLDEKWSDAGFCAISQFSWENYSHKFGNDLPYLGETPVWWLLARGVVLNPEQGSQPHTHIPAGS